MKTTLLLITLMLMIFSTGISFAQSGTDTFGMYFNTDGTGTDIQTAAPFTPVTAYLCVKFPSSGGISGWECKVNIEQVAGSGLVAQSWSHAGGGLNVYDPVATGLFNVGVGVGALALLPVNNTVVLATYSAFVMAPTDVHRFFILPFPGSVTFPASTEYPGGTPGYVDGEDVGIIKRCGVSSGTPTNPGPGWAPGDTWGDHPVLTINTIEVVSNTNTSWSAVKALYQ